MSARTLLVSIITVVMSFTAATSATEAVPDRDGELMEALHLLAAEDLRWTVRDWEDFGTKATKYAIAATAAAGAGVALYYFRMPRGFVRKSFRVSTGGLERVGKFFTAHGGKVILTVAGPLLITDVVNRLIAMNNISDAERLRTASTPDARVYRSHLRHFFKLSVPEQYLVARQDPVFTDDLIRLAHWVQLKNAKNAAEPIPAVTDPMMLMEAPTTAGGDSPLTTTP